MLGLNGEVHAVNVAVLAEFGGSNLGVPAQEARRLLENASVVPVKHPTNHGTRAEARSQLREISLDTANYSSPGSGTVRTGHRAFRTTFPATLPGSMCLVAPRPWVPMTIRSIP